MATKMRKVDGEKIKKNDFGMADQVGDRRYPKIYIDIKHIPEAKKWKMGGKYPVTFLLNMTGISINRNETTKKEFGSADFEILEIGFPEDMKADEPKDKKKKKKSEPIARTVY